VHSGDAANESVASRSDSGGNAEVRLGLSGHRPGSATGMVSMASSPVLGQIVSPARPCGWSATFSTGGDTLASRLVVPQRASELIDHSRTKPAERARQPLAARRETIDALRARLFQRDRSVGDTAWVCVEQLSFGKNHSGSRSGRSRNVPRSPGAPSRSAPRGGRAPDVR